MAASPPAPGVENAALRAAPVHDPGEQLGQNRAPAQDRHHHQDAQNRRSHESYRMEEGARAKAEPEQQELAE